MSSNTFTAYYQEEIIALRKDAYLFGKRYPDLAGGLGLHWGDTPDPMLERLIESMAWFSARIRQDSQARMPLAAQQILGKIHPHFVCPIPSIGIASLTLGEGFADSFPAGKILPAGSRFHCDTAEGESIRWRTGWPTLLSGAKVIRHGFTSKSPNKTIENGSASYCLSLVVKDLRTLPTLRLYLRGDPFSVHPLHQWVHTNLMDVVVADAHAPGDREPVRLGKDALQPGGLSTEELALPRASYAHPAYQLLQEYFVCPDRFLFWDFDLSGYTSRHAMTEITIQLRLPPPGGVSTDFLQFDPLAVPVVNLYETLAEPISVDHTRHSYPLRATRTGNDYTEVHSILEVEAVYPGSRVVTVPRYGTAFSTANPGADACRWRWHERRSLRPSGTGTDVELFFKTPTLTGLEEPFTASARVLCTNGVKAAALGSGTRLDKDDAMDVDYATMERPPTRQSEPALSGDDLWLLISAMTLHHQALSGKNGLAALREILRLFVPPEYLGALAQIDGITSFECADTLLPLRPTRHRPMGGAARGHAFRMGLDPNAFKTGSAFLFASVIESFLALFAGINSFTRLTACIGNEELYRWPARSGRQRL